METITYSNTYSNIFLDFKNINLKGKMLALRTF